MGIFNYIRGRLVHIAAQARFLFVYEPSPADAIGFARAGKAAES